MQKQNLILLHGALGSKAQLAPLKQSLSSAFEVYAFDFDGHGNNVSEEAFEMSLFSRNLGDFMAANDISQAHLFGYSMGGYVALAFARVNPGKVGKIVTLGTKFDWNPEVSEAEVRKLNPNKIEEKVPAFAKMLAETHGDPNWKSVVSRTADMMAGLGNGKAFQLPEFSEIGTEVLLLLAENDVMVTAGETESVLKALPHATFKVIEGAKHPIETVNVGTLAEIAGNFLNQ